MNGGLWNLNNKTDQSNFTMNGDLWNLNNRGDVSPLFFFKSLSVNDKYVGSSMSFYGVRGALGLPNLRDWNIFLFLFYLL
jgi:hypothetical protein